MSSNFDFLKIEFPKYAEYGISAERKFYEAPADAIKDIGLMCEKMAIQICEYYGIEVDSHFGPVQARIDALRKEEIITREQAKSLHAIRTRRNKAVHDGKGTTDDCIELFPEAYEFACWFANTFGKNNYSYDDYVIPDPAKSSKRDIYYVDAPTNQHDVELALLQDKKDRRKTNLKVLGWIFGFLLLLATFIGVMAYMEEEKIENEHEKYLKTVSEIETMIEKGNYDKAENEIEKLWPEQNIPIESDKDEVPAKLLASIEERKAKDNNTTVPTCSIPRSSKSLKGDNYKDVARELQDAGFLRIYAKIADSKSSVIHRKDTVMRISIDGESDFDKGDQYAKTVKIIIYYYYYL